MSKPALSSASALREPAIGPTIQKQNSAGSKIQKMGRSSISSSCLETMTVVEPQAVWWTKTRNMTGRRSKKRKMSKISWLAQNSVPRLRAHATGRIQQIKFARLKRPTRVKQKRRESSLETECAEPNIFLKIYEFAVTFHVMNF